MVNGYFCTGCNRTFGDNCSNPCPINCLDRQCHSFTGQCFNCVPGYQGQDCNQECENGKYGLNCENNCGHCQQDTQCHNVNSSCLQGCSPGYIGSFCNITCSKTFYGLNCLQQCSANCVNQTCHHESGTCQLIDASKSDKVKQVYIIGGVVGVVIVFILIFGILILYKRNGCVKWKRDKDTTFNNSEAVAQSSPNTALNLSNIYQNIQIDDSATARGNDKTADDDNDVDIDEKIHNENPYGDVYKNEKTIPYVAVGNLGNEIIEKSKNENDGFKKEYATLLYGERYPCNVAKRPENIQRNRFKTTFPYDHSRVVLVSANTDYINANYIDGLNKEKQYIAAQCQLKSHTYIGF
nr:platelet endothelial aggregation receptor 1-like isoform X1 [Crassostrea gigas]